MELRPQFWHFFVSVFLIYVPGAVVTEPNCQSFIATRDKDLVLPCRADGCHLSQPRWFNITNDGIRKEIRSAGINSYGELEVTRSAQSVVGGQKYQCTCGENTQCIVIHIPPLVEIEIEPPDVQVGGDIRVTCYTSEPGFPQPSTITLQYNGSHMKLGDGSPYMFHNLQLGDAGELKCMLDDVTTQPSKSATLNVYKKTHINSTVSAIVSDQRTAIIGCSVIGNQNRTVVRFLKDGVQIPNDNHKFTELTHIQKDHMAFWTHLLVTHVTESDEGCYLCQVFVNYTELVLVDTGELFIHSQPVINTDIPTSCSCTKHWNELIGMGVALVILLAVAIAGWGWGLYCWRRYKTRSPGIDQRSKSCL